MLLKHMPDTTNTDRKDEKSVKQCRRIDHTYYTLSALHMTQRMVYNITNKTLQENHHCSYLIPTNHINIQWLGHVERMDETAMPKRVLKGKLYAMKRIGRPKIRWLEDVIADLRRIGISGWMEKARNRDQWRQNVEEAKAHPGL